MEKSLIRLCFFFSFLKVLLSRLTRWMPSSRWEWIHLFWDFRKKWFELPASSFESEKDSTAVWRSVRERTSSSPTLSGRWLHRALLWKTFTFKNEKENKRISLWKLRICVSRSKTVAELVHDIGEILQNSTVETETEAICLHNTNYFVEKDIINPAGWNSKQSSDGNQKGQS